MKFPILLSSAMAAALTAVAPQPVAAQDAEIVPPPPPVQLRRTPEPPAGDTPDFSNLDQDDALAELEREIEAEFGVLAELFKPDPLTPEQEAVLPLAQQMTDKIFPEGTFGKVMKDAMAPLMGTMMGAIAGDPRIRLVAVTGVSGADLSEISDEDAQEALNIFDPGYADRTTKMGDLVVEMIGRLFDEIEPSYRDAIARALTTRFTEAEMREAVTMLESPVGAKLAQESFLLQYDPQMLTVMEQLGPAMMQVMPGMMQDFADFDEQMADEGRNFAELSSAERERAARLLGKSEQELDALTPETEDIEVEVEEDVI